jgi:DNA primase
MTGIPKDFITEIVTRTDIVEIIDARVTLKKKGGNYSARCPFHNEKTPSFSVSHTKQFYHCFGCGAHGNVIGFLMAYDRLEFPEAVEILASQLGLPVPKTATQQKTHNTHYELLSKVADYYQSQLHRSPTALTYLTNRGLSQETIRRFGIGFASAGWDNALKQFGHTPTLQSALLETGILVKNEQQRVYDRKQFGHTPTLQSALLETGILVKNEQQRVYDRFRDRIIIPIKDSRGRVIGFGGRTLGNDTPKYLNSPETPLFHKGSELYGFYEARQANQKLAYTLVVEGYMDVIALHQFGITQAVGTLGTATSTIHLQRLFRHTEKIIVCFDGDRAGKDAAWRALETSLPIIRDGLHINFMFLPEGEDPDSFIRKEGQATFEQYIHNATHLPDFFFHTLCQQIGLSPLNVKKLDIEGKAKLNNLAYPLIQKIRPGVFQTLMLDQLSELLHVSVEKLQDLHPKAMPPLTRERRTLIKHMPNKTKLLSPIQLALTLLLQHPKLVNDPMMMLPDTLRELKHPGTTVLVQLFDLLKNTENLTTGAILEHWRESNLAQRLAELASWELLIPEEGVAAEFCDTIKKIALLERENEIQRLMNKAAEQTLTDEEKKSLMVLLKKRH